MKKRAKFYYDSWLLIAAFSILAIGLIMVTSVSMVISEKQYHYPFYYVLRQMTFLSIGLFIMLIVSRIKSEWWERSGGYLTILSLALLVAVLIPGIGREVNGGMRWISFGLFSMQVSEFAKLCIIIYLAGYVVRREDEVQTRMRGFLKPLILLGFFSLLLLQEPDFGTMVVMLSTALTLLFIAGVRLWQFLLLLTVSVGILCVLAISAPYRVVRLTTFLHPWANQYDTGYQLTQSLIAFGRGGFWGVGLGNSVQKLFYLPEAHTDFLFAVLGEELGLIGCLAVVGLFALLVGRSLVIGRRAYKQGKPFNAYLAWGLGIGLGLQVMINIGVNVGMLPTKGLTLPLMSYGGSSLLMYCLIVGILLRLSYETPGYAAVKKAR
jgi:cell division protein FtsW